MRLWHRTTIRLLATLSTISACGCGTVLKLPPSKQASNRSATDVKLSAMAVAGSEDDDVTYCELLLTLRTYDAVIASKPVCIKHPGQGISIPERIFLKSTKAVNKDRYCEPAGHEEEDGYVGCVWNRRFFNNFPIGFVIESGTINGKREPLSQHASLVRILRNGKAVYSWESKQDPKLYALEIPPTVVTAHEYFRDPVDLGLYVLQSGAEEAQAAAATQYETARAKWSETLTHALTAAALADVPQELKDSYACFASRLQYLKARASRDDSGTKLAEQRMLDLDQRANDIRNGLKNAGEVQVATSDFVDTAKSGKADGTVLKDAAYALLLNKDGTQADVFQAHAGKAWSKGKPSDTKAAQTSVTVVRDTLGAPSTTEPLWFVKVDEGTHGKATFALNKDASPSSARLTSDPVGCSPPSAAVKALQNDVDRAIKASASNSAVVTNIDKQREVVESYVRNNKQTLEDAVARLPPNAADRIRKGFFWARYVEDVTANSLAAGEELRAAVPVLKATINNALKGPEERLRAYEAFAAALPQEDTFWSKAIPNPAPGPEESRFAMRFFTPRQRYWLLAWNGVPMPILSSSGVKNELHVENLIPIIDNLRRALPAIQ